MTTSDPMGVGAGRILLNGNAESTQRFCELAHSGAGDSTHRDPWHRKNNRVALIMASWGRGETNDDSIRKRFQDLGRGEVLNTELFGEFVRVMRDRPTVKSLFDEHEAAWEQLYASYCEENDALVANLRQAWERAQADLGATGMHELLTMGDRMRPGPPTRPVQQYVERGYAQRMRRHVEALVQADDRRSQVMTELWEHFHLAAGLSFDSLWHECRHDIESILLQSSLIALTGGDPSKLLVAMRFFQLQDVLLEAVRRGAHVFGSSAGAMVLGRRVVIFHDRRNPRQEFQLFDNGIGLVGGFQVFPHVNDRLQTEDSHNLAYLANRFRHRNCVGLNAGSTLGLEARDGGWRAWSAGDDDVVLFNPEGTKRRLQPGDEL